MNTDIKTKLKSVMELYNATFYQIADGDIPLQSKLARQINKEASVTADVLYLFLSKFPELSAEWLLRGEGEMFRNNPSGTSAVTITGQNHVGNVNTGIYNEAAKGNNTEDDEITDADFECIEEIPVVPAAAVKAPGVDLMTYVEDNQQHIEQRKVVKGGVIADFIVRVKDVSLMPEYMPGDELYLKEIDITKGILNGNVYAVDTDSKGMVIRVLNDGGDHFVASSFNNNRFRDSIIQKDDVLRIYNITQLRRIPN